jgi:hypothetical protein
MQKYKSHKVVEAMKIEEMNFDVPDAPFLAGDHGPIQPKPGYFVRHNPDVGGYYVRYKDGYESYSPVEAFEAGYTLYDESKEYDQRILLDVRNKVEKVLVQHPDFKFGGSAGVGITGADLDMLIDGERWNIRIQPRDK